MVSPKDHLKRCCKKNLYGLILSALLSTERDIRPRDVAEPNTEYSETMIGNYFRRLKNYGVLTRHRNGLAVYYGFVDTNMRRETERLIGFQKAA